MNPHQIARRMEDRMKPEEYEKVTDGDIEKAEAHVVWFLEMVKPLMISFMVHGIKHGRQEKK